MFVPPKMRFFFNFRTGGVDGGMVEIWRSGGEGVACASVVVSDVQLNTGNAHGV